MLTSWITPQSLMSPLHMCEVALLKCHGTCGYLLMGESTLIVSYRTIAVIAHPINAAILDLQPYELGSRVIHHRFAVCHIM